MGRPDMAYFGFTNKMVKGETIKVFNNGDLKRDFTYVDDIVTGICRLIPLAPTGENPAEVYNIGNNNPEDLLHFIEVLENCLMAEGIIHAPAKKEFLPMQKSQARFVLFAYSLFFSFLNMSIINCIEGKLKSFLNSFGYKIKFKVAPCIMQL
jgi:nucleoside-diphosphate-sugar epimerase